jgi:hypothetical protein
MFNIYALLVICYSLHLETETDHNLAETWLPIGFEYLKQYTTEAKYTTDGA